MIKVYIYASEGLADWEAGYIMAELNTKRFFKENAPEISVEVVGFSKRQYRTMGGMLLNATLSVKDIEVSDKAFLILFGADSWNENKQKYIIDKAKEILRAGGHVAGICGATVALANGGVLDGRKHTSNDKELLKSVAENYRGEEYYVTEKAVFDRGLITAGSAGVLEWTKLIMENLGTFTAETIDYWYKFYSTGNPEYYNCLIMSPMS